MNINQILVLISIVFIFMIQLIQTKNKNKKQIIATPIKSIKKPINNNLIKWNNKKAANYFYYFIKKFGKPTKINTNQNGFAFWQFDYPEPWNVILITDSLNNYIKTSIELKLPKHLQQQIINFSKLIKIDNNNLVGMGDNYIKLIVNFCYGLMLINNMITLDEIVKNNLIKKSIMKASKRLLVENKYESQIIELIKYFNDNSNKKSDQLDYEVDLAKNQDVKQNIDQDTDFLPGLDGYSGYATF